MRLFKKLFGWAIMGCMLFAVEGTAMNRSEPKPLVIILLGPPGAGKGTHAAPLSGKLGLPHISTGDLFRENIRNATPLGQKVKSFMDSGNLVPDELVLDMLFDRILQPDCAKGYILDGFPRTLAQAKALDARLGNQNRVVALNFNIPDEDLIPRITGRLICKGCKKPYHKMFDPPAKQGICDVCGSSLYTRDDDTEEVVRKRLVIYHAETQPLIDYYAAKKIVKEIDSKNAKERVFQDVLAALPDGVKKI